MAESLREHLQTTSSEALDPTRPEHNIVRIREIGTLSKSFDATFADGSPFFTRIEFSITELCNRKCVFCPRFDESIYPNRNLHMSPQLYEKIMRELAFYGWSGGVVFSGFGEPLLHNDLLTLVRLTKQYLPDSILDVVTNGDRLTFDHCRDLYEAGLDVMKVSLYDGPHQIPHFEVLRDRLGSELGIEANRFIIRHRFLPAEEGFGLILSNRAGTVSFPDLPLEPLDQPLRQECHFPFYKLMVDWDGRVLLCSHDWSKKLVAGDLRTQTVAEVWTGKTMRFVRARLMNKDRRFKPCVGCNVDGTLNGQEEFDRWKDFSKA